MVRTITGRATFRIVLSRLTISRLTHSTASVSLRRRSRPPPAAAFRPGARLPDEVACRLTESTVAPLQRRRAQLGEYTPQASATSVFSDQNKGPGTGKGRPIRFIRAMTSDVDTAGLTELSRWATGYHSEPGDSR